MTDEKVKDALATALDAMKESNERLFDIAESLNHGASHDDIERAYKRSYRGNICRAIDAVESTLREMSNPAPRAADYESDAGDPNMWQDDAPAPDAERMDAEWPQEGDMYWSWAENSAHFNGVSLAWAGSPKERKWLRNGEVHRTEAEAEAEWNRRHGKKADTTHELTDVAKQIVHDARKIAASYRDTAHELTDAEKQMVRNGQQIPAIRSLRVRTGMGLRDAKAIVDAYRDSLKASKPCPTGVPENGEWMPGWDERYWDAADGERWSWHGGPSDLQSLEDGDVCRTRAIARTVQRRRKAAGKAVAE